MNTKILVTGATGRVAGPVAEAMAENGSEVWAVGRFSEPGARSRLDELGIHTYAWDMAADALDGLPDDFTHVMHAAMLSEFDDFDRAIEGNCRAAAALMGHCRQALAFLFVSSSVVYQRLSPGHLHLETDPLGGTSTPTWAPAYGATKIAAEGTVRALARTIGLPTTIARLSVAYGSATGAGDGQGGLPVQLTRRVLQGESVPIRPNDESWCSPLHWEDIVAQVPRLWEVATVPATVVNWGGDDAVAQREIMAYISELTGMAAHFVETTAAPGMVAIDPSKRRSLVGPCQVSWHEGMRRALATYFPDALTVG